MLNIHPYFKNSFVLELHYIHKQNSNFEKEACKLTTQTARFMNMATVVTSEQFQYWQHFFVARFWTKLPCQPLLSTSAILGHSPQDAITNQVFKRTLADWNGLLVWNVLHTHHSYTGGRPWKGKNLVVALQSPLGFIFNFFYSPSYQYLYVWWFSPHTGCNIQCKME